MYKRLSSGLISTLIALQCVACGSTSVTQVAGPDNIRCQTTLGSTPTIPAAGGHVTVGVVAARECTWNAGSEASWISVSPTAGQGEASIVLNASANPQATTRTGNIVVNGQRFALSQAPAPCTFELTPASIDMPAEGGSSTVRVSSLTGCTWTATSNSGWIHVTSAAGTGTGDVVLGIEPNGGTSARAAQISIAGSSFTVSQSAPAPPAPTPAPPPAPAPEPSPSPAPAPAPAPAPSPSPTPAPQCSYSIDPVTRTFKDKGGDGSVKVMTTSTCSWTATSNVAWVRITENASGTGNKDVKYKVEANQTGVQRIGSLTVAGQTHWIVQQPND